MLKLSYQTLLALNQGLAALDGRLEPILDKDHAVVGQRRVEKPVLSLGATLAVAKARRTLEGPLKDLEHARKEVVARHLPDGTEVPVGSAAHQALERDLEALVATEVEVDLPRFTLADLGLVAERAKDGLPLPTAAISHLLPLLDA